MTPRRYLVRLAVAFALAAIPVASVTAARVLEAEQYFVVGAVTSPGAYTLKADATVADAIDAAGGITPSRAVSSIQIVRITNGETETLDASFNDLVRGNDVIRVR